MKKMSWKAVLDKNNISEDRAKKAFYKIVIMEQYTGDIYDAMAKELDVNREDAKRILFTIYFRIPHLSYMMQTRYTTHLEYVTECRKITAPNKILSTLHQLKKSSDRRVELLKNRLYKGEK